MNFREANGIGKWKGIDAARKERLDNAWRRGVAGSLVAPNPTRHIRLPAMLGSSRRVEPYRRKSSLVA
jgi:hypothetical protein